MIYSKTKTNVTLKLVLMQQSFCFLFKKNNKFGQMWQKNNEFKVFEPLFYSICCSQVDYFAVVRAGNRFFLA